MTPSRRVRSSAASCVAILALVAFAGRSDAQVSQLVQGTAVASGFSLDPLARSPSLIGMGQLSLVGSDPHYRITLWDFGGNPTGAGVAESTSTIDLRPDAVGASDVQDFIDSSGRIRQSYAAHGGDLGYEMWRRQGRLTYGAIGNLGTLQTDQPYSDDVEHRANLKVPSVTPIITGVMPFTHSGRTRYSLDVRWSEQSLESRYLGIVQNAAGDFISLDSDERKPPNVFVPESFDVRHVGGGGAVSHVVAPWLTVAGGYDGVGVRINGENPDKRNISQTHELRPYNIGQATLIGRIGRDIEWGVDGRGWKSTSETSWNFTISAGQGAIPLSGRGKLLERHEEGTTMRSRAVWHAGSFDIGAGWNTNYNKVDVTAPALDDHTSFNYFMNTVFNRGTADSLALADSVSTGSTALHGWEAGGGLAWRLPSQRGTVGVEYHKDRLLEQSLSAGLGPRRVGWDVRMGADLVCTPAIRARVGYQYRWDDEDDYTKQNEYLSNVVTGGVGVSPKRSMWRFDLSYAIRWLHADYGDPSYPHGSRQQLRSQIHWAF